MTKIAVVANTEKFVKKDARRLRESLAGAGFEDVQWIDVKKGSDSKPATARAVKRGARGACWYVHSIGRRTGRHRQPLRVRPGTTHRHR